MKLSFPKLFVASILKSLKSGQTSLITYFPLIFGPNKSKKGTSNLNKKKMKIILNFYIFDSVYNRFHNIWRLFDVLPNFLFTTSKTNRNYYL